MTFPSGAPGGFPGQGPQQPQQSFPGAGPSRGAGPKLSLPQILFLVAAGLGVLNLFLSFASLAGGQSFYELRFGWIPALLLVSGLAALLGLLPGDEKPGPWPAAIAAGVVLAFLFTVFQIDADLEAGGIMVLIFGLIQMGAAIAAYLFDAGILKPPAPQQKSPYGQAGPYGQQPGGFGQPYGQQQYGQQQPSPDQSGGIPQPTKFAQPVSPGQPGQPPGQPGQPGQQPTQYASQQGQFFQQQQQQQSQEGGQQNQQGNQPGGFGQSSG